MTTAPAAAGIEYIEELLGGERVCPVAHTRKTIDKGMLYLAQPDYLDGTFIVTDRSATVLRNMVSMYNRGSLAGTRYLSIQPVDKGMRHSAGVSFAPDGDYLNPENALNLAIMGLVQRRRDYAGRARVCGSQVRSQDPFVLKFNHNKFLSHPDSVDQILFASIDQAFDMGCVGGGATIYVGSEGSKRQIKGVISAFEYVHELGVFCILRCYHRKPAFKTKGGLTGRSRIYSSSAAQRCRREYL